LRKASALRELGKITEALEAARTGYEVSGKNEVFEKLVEEIEKEYKEDNKFPADDPEMIKIRDLCDWLQTGGAIFDKLKIKYYEKNYRGVHSSQIIKANELILFIPKSHLITLEMARQTPVGKKMMAAGLSLLSPKHSYLSTFLLDEKFNGVSWWAPYIRMLPSDFDSMPIFFPEEDLKWLEGSPFLDQVTDKKADIRKDYDAILKVAPEFGRYSFWEFCWARMNACSRIFGINIDGVKTDAFVPLADMLNHRRPKQTAWSYSDEKKGFIIESLEDIERGGHVYDSYGKKCNSRFLLNYGFIVLENDGNEVALRVNYKNDDPCIKAKTTLLKENPQPRTFRVMAQVEEENTVEFLNFLRFVNIRDNQTILEVMSIYENSRQNDKDKEDGYKPQKTPPLSLEIEQRVLEDCKAICLEQLKCYPTTLEKDLELLKTNTLTTNQRNCVLLRSGEKEILHELIKFSEICLPLLDMSLKEIRKLTTQIPYNKYAEYINKAIITVVQRRENGTK